MDLSDGIFASYAWGMASWMRLILRSRSYMICPFKIPIGLDSSGTVFGLTGLAGVLLVLLLLSVIVHIVMAVAIKRYTR